jgi:lipopolysaccharide heptosyltransferase II
MQSKPILIFNVNWLGDVLFSTAAIRNIRRNFPEAFVACAIPSRCYQVLKGNPYLDEVIIFDERQRHKGLIAKLNFIKLLKKKKFDTVFLLHRSFSRALLCRLAGIGQRIGYYTPKRAFLLTKSIPLLQKDSSHRIDYYLTLVEKAGLKVEDRFTDFHFGEEDKKLVCDFLRAQAIREGDFLVAINPGGNWRAKRWPKDYWSALADRLISEFKAKVIITGAHQDLNLAGEIKRNMLQEPIITCGKFNLKQLAALSVLVDVFITADTGPLHIANAAGAKKIIALFGPTSVLVTGPYPLKNVIVLQKDVGCKVPCYQVHCRDNRCMRAITPDEVLAEVRLVLKK